MTNNSKINKWKRWLNDHIEKEIIHLEKLRIVYLKIEEIVKSNNNLPDNNYFYFWFRSTYASAAASAVRRQTDTDCQCISLAKLLLEIMEAPHLISRQDYLNRKIGSNVMPGPIFEDDKKCSNAEFTSFAGKGEYLDHKIIAADFDKIDRIENPTIKRLVSFTDWFVAHHDKRQLNKKDEKPNYNELHQCIKNLVEIFEKYNQLVTGSDMPLLDKVQRKDLERDIDIIFD